MNPTKTRSRWLAPLTLGLALALAQAPAAPARAQEDPGIEGEGGESKGRPFDGYFATSLLAGLAIFIIAKSARR
jgi:hypothetical protein